MKKYILTTLFFYFVFSNAFAQNVDEPVYLAKISAGLSSQVPQERFLANVNLVRYWNFRNDEKGLLYAQNALLIAKEVSQKIWIAQSKMLIAQQKIGLKDYQGANNLLWEVADEFQNKQDTILAEAQYMLSENADFLEHIDNKIPFAKKAYETAQKTGNQKFIAQSAAELAFFYVVVGDNPNAILMQHEANKAVALVKENGDWYLIRTYATLETVAMELGDFISGVEYCNQLSVLCSKNFNVRFACFARFGLGYVHNEHKEFEQAIPYFEQNIKILHSIGKKGDLGSNLDYLGISLTGLEDFKKALPYHFEALKIAKKEGFTDHVVSTSHTIAKCLVKMKKYDEATIYFQQALDLSEKAKLNNFNNIAFDYADLLQKQGKYELALSIYQRGVTARDTIFNLENERKIKTIELKTQSETYEAKVQTLNLSLKNQQLMLVGTSLFLALVFLLAFLFYRQNQFKQRTQLAENQLKMQEIRNRFAADLHDEIGSTLTNIEMLSVIGQQLDSNEKSLSFFNKISNEAKATNDAIHNIVWSVNPENDKLENIFVRIRQVATETLENQKINTFIDITDTNENIVLEPEKRRDLFLAFKEILTNILKYAQASEVHIRLFIHENTFHFEIKDNGIGFDIDNLKANSNGLQNMKNRIVKWKGSFKICGKTGTQIWIKLPL